eukprot:CAMPEP_0117418156 /NCGR_PEP_ID=MMETSP0758-20121206/4_1 /TAXON_ID=63605 /ORGANISM="Percolomonas cosmopolitus, Strain AE-1 (ATCC 50343)" /LENGTH=419 /DNA_ID=CAMNT_0005198511 /DNA_START=459 /DNA_END=1718 /DNA_ORIENTATION=-
MRQMEKERNDNNTKFSKLEGICEKIEAQKEQLLKDVTTQATLITNLKETIEQREQTIAERDASNKELDNKLRACEQEIDNWKGTHKADHDRISNLETLFDALKQEKKELVSMNENQQAKASSSNTELNKTVEKLIDEKDKLKEDFKQMVKDHQKENGKLVKQLVDETTISTRLNNDLDTTKELLKVTLEDFESYKQLMSRQMEELKGKYKNTVQTLDETAKKLEETTNTLANQDEQYNLEKQTLLTTQEQLANREKQNAVLTSENEQLNLTISTQNKNSENMNANIRALTKQLTELQKDHDVLKVQHERACQILKETESLQRIDQERISNLSKQLDTSNRSYKLAVEESKQKDVRTESLHVSLDQLLAEKKHLENMNRVYKEMMPNVTQADIEEAIGHSPSTLLAGGSPKSPEPVLTKN